MNIPPLPPANRRLPFLMVIGLFGLGLGFLYNMLDPFIYAEKVRLLAPPALKNTALSVITLMVLLMALLTQPLVGWLSDHTRSRWGRRAPYLLAGVVGVTFNLAVVVSADNFWLLLGAAMLMVAAANTTQSAWQALIPDQTPATQHGAAAGIKTLWELIGLVIGVTLVGASLARGYLWTAPLTVMGLLWGILAITWYVLGRWGLQEAAARPAAPRASSLWNRLARQPSHRLTLSHVKAIACQRWLAVASLIRAAPGFSWWMVNRFLFLAAGVAVRTFVLNYLHDVLAFSPAEAQSLTSRLTLVLGSGVFLLALPAGAIADRVGRRPLLLIAGLLAAVGAVILIFSRHLPLLYVAAGLIGGGAGIFASSSWALATDLAPKANSALYLGLANSAGVVGSMAGRLGGPLIDGVNQLTGAVAMGYLLVFGAAALFFVASSVVVLRIPGRH